MGLTLNLNPSTGGNEGGYPIFGSKNYINQDAIDYGTFTSSEMQSIFSRIIDGDPYSLWNGSVASDATTVTFLISLMSRTANVSRTIDLMIFQNINWKNFLAEYSNDGGATYTTVPGLDYRVGTADNAKTDIAVNVAAGFTAKLLRVSIYGTITPNQTKQCGGIIACAAQIQLSAGFLGYKLKNREVVREHTYVDGSLGREYLLHSAASYEFYGASFDCPYATAAELATLRTIKRVGDGFIFMPEPGDDPRSAFLCHFDGPWGHAYESPVRSAGYLIPMKVKEIGSH